MIPNNAPYGALIRFGIVLLIGIMLWIGGCQQGKRGERAAHDSTKAAHAEVLARLSTLAAVAAERARAASEAVRAYRDAADTRLKEAQDEADREADRLRADLADGRRRLQDRWTCPVPGAGQGDAASDAGAADAAGRHDSAVRIVRAADHDAALISWLYDAWAADRKAVIAGGCAVE